MQTMADNIVLAPTLTHLLTAIVLIIAWGKIGLQRVLTVAGGVIALIFSVALFVTHALPEGGRVTSLSGGNWLAPYGIAFVVDPISSILLLANGVVGLACIVYGIGSIDSRREKWGFHALTHTLLSATTGAFIAGDLFNLYVWFEVMLISSFVLLTLAGGRSQLEGAIKYVALNLLSSTIFLVGVGLLYGLVGTLNMADIGLRLRATDDPRLVTVIATLFIVAYGIKAGAFPLFFWLPASYHTPPAAVSALFSGLLSKVGVYALMRVFLVVFPDDRGFTGTVMLWMGALTMLSGALGAMAQRDFRRALSFQIIGAVGFMLAGLGVALVCFDKAAGLTGAERDAYTAAAGIALAGVVFYILHDIIVKTNLFMVAGQVQRRFGTGDIGRLGGVYRSAPFLSLLFMVPALSLAGIPVLSGFWGKLAVIRAGVQAEAFWVVGAALVASVLTLYAMMKIWREAFWRDDARGEGEIAEEVRVECRYAEGGWRDRMMTAPSAVLAVGAVVIGFAAGPIYSASERAAAHLLDPLQPDGYTRTVLQEERVDGVLAFIERRNIQFDVEPLDGESTEDPVAISGVSLEGETGEGAGR